MTSVLVWCCFSTLQQLMVISAEKNSQYVQFKVIPIIGRQAQKHIKLFRTMQQYNFGKLIKSNGYTLVIRVVS